MFNPCDAELFVANFHLFEARIPIAIFSLKWREIFLYEKYDISHTELFKAL